MNDLVLPDRLSDFVRKAVKDALVVISNDIGEEPAEEAVGLRDGDLNDRFKAEGGR